MNSDSIFDATQKTVKRFGTRDPFEIIKASRGMKLWFEDSFSEDGLRGFATIQNRIRYIVVNDLLCEEEQRVVAAHELGHTTLHTDVLRVRAMKDFDVFYATGRLEREANLFAADILLDDEQVMDEVQSSGADFFSVAKALYIPAPFLSFKLFSMIQRGYPLRLPEELNSRFLAAPKKRKDHG